MNEVKGIVINPDSGEIDNELYYGDRIVRARSDEYLSDTVIINHNDKFSKIYTAILPELVETLTPAECKMLMSLTSFLRKDSGVLKYKNGRPVTTEDIIKQNKASRSTVERALQGLQDKDIVQYIKRPQGRFLIMNPYVVMNGRRIDKTCYDIFYKSKWAARCRNGNDLCK